MEERYIHAQCYLGSSRPTFTTSYKESKLLKGENRIWFYSGQGSSFPCPRIAEGMILLNFWPSAYAMRARIAPAEKGLEYESREQDLENKSDFLLQMNPVNKTVPVLIHNGKAVYESLIIVHHNDEVWKDKTSLLPSDPYQIAQARFCANFVDQNVCAYCITGKLIR